MNRILITRPEPGAGQTAERLAAAGFIPIIAPIQKIIARDLHAPDHVAATILTSRNAVASCPQSLHARPVFAVGTATATLAAQFGFCHVHDADGNADALAKLVSATLSPTQGSLFLPTAPGNGRSLAVSLRRQGFRVLRRIAYHADLVPILPEAAAVELRLNRLAAVMFFSGEISRHFVRLLRDANLVDAAHNVEAVAISEQAAVALRSLCWRRISVAMKPNQDAMLALLK